MILGVWRCDCHGIALPFDWEVQEVITSCSGRLFVPCNAVLLSNVVFLRSNKNITLSLAWNVIPNAGTLPKVNGDGGYTFEFPTEYSSSRSWAYRWEGTNLLGILSWPSSNFVWAHASVQIQTEWSDTWNYDILIK